MDLLAYSDSNEGEPPAGQAEGPVRDIDLVSSMFLLMERKHKVMKEEKSTYCAMYFFSAMRKRGVHGQSSIQA